MKIVALSDTHGYFPDIPVCDVVFICGDISPLEIQEDMPSMQVWLRSKFAEWINNMPCEQVFMIAGNHDYIFEWIGKNEQRINYYIEQPTRYKLQLLENTVCNFKDKEDNIYKVWGSPYCKIFGNWAFAKEKEELQEAYETMPKDCDFVLFHDAPRIGKLDVISEGLYKGTKCGKTISSKIIKQKAPRFVFCGHIHSGDHNLSTVKGYGKTQFANVSYVNEKYHPVNNVLCVTI